MGSIQAFDFSILNSIRDSMSCAFLDYFAVILSYITTWGLIWIVLGVVLIFFKKTRALGVVLLIALALGFLTGDLLLKHVISRPRPFVMNPGVSLLISPPSGASFPSTHCCFAAAVTTVLLLNGKKLGFVALAATVCIAFSRMYLYVHFPSDVLAGLVLGVICGVAAVVIGNLLKLEKRLGSTRA